MIVTMATGSQMDRALRCPASLALPQIHDANPKDDRDKGSAMHKFLERVPVVGRELALFEIDAQHRDFCADIDIAKLADQLKLSTEVALAYNWREDTARRLLPLEHRAYDVDVTCEIPLTMDLAGVGVDAVYAGDYKSGHGWLPEPHQSMQLGIGALALARLHEASRAEVEYIRVRDDGTVRKFREALDIFGLEGVATRVHETMTAIEVLRAELAAGAVPNVTEGPWCRHCKAAQHCPAKTALVRVVMTDPQPIPYLSPLMPESALRAYQLLTPAKAAIKQVEAALYAYAKSTPILISTEADGTQRWFGEVAHPGHDELDGAIVHAVLTEAYDGAIANTAVTLEATKTAITDVARKHLKPGEKIAHVVDALLQKVKDRKGVSNKAKYDTQEFTVSPDGETKVRKRKAS